VTLLNCSPPRAIRNPAYLCARDAESLRQSSLDASLPGLDGLADELNVLLGELRGYAAFAVLHGAVASHVKLVGLMRVPSQVRDMVVRWIAIVVTNVSLMVKRWRQEGESDKAVQHSPMWFRIAGLSQHMSDVTQFCFGSRNDDGLFSSGGFGVFPNAAFSSPRPDKSVIGNVVLWESGDLSPFALGPVHG
jgi:hypothetical protein